MPDVFPDGAVTQQRGVGILRFCRRKRASYVGTVVILFGKSPDGIPRKSVRLCVVVPDCDSDIVRRVWNHDWGWGLVDETSVLFRLELAGPVIPSDPGMYAVGRGGNGVGFLQGEDFHRSGTAFRVSDTSSDFAVLIAAYLCVFAQCLGIVGGERNSCGD